IALQYREPWTILHVVSTTLVLNIIFIQTTIQQPKYLSSIRLVKTTIILAYLIDYFYKKGKLCLIKHKRTFLIRMLCLFTDLTCSSLLNMYDSFDERDRATIDGLL
ncbi:hypothetical protein ACJX0J_018785, partial [Zea mays]